MRRRFRGKKNKIQLYLEIIKQNTKRKKKRENKERKEIRKIERQLK